MKKILFPTDFSKTSLNAFVYALHFAKNISAEIIILHVYELPIIDTNYTDTPIYLTQIYESIDLSNFENFKDQVPTLYALAKEYDLEDIKLNNVLLEGDLAINMLELIDKEEIDIVVMGTHGASGWKEIFVGSMTAKIMASTQTIVLGVPEASEFEPIKRIVFTTKFKDEDIDALLKITEMAENFNAHIDCLYVKPPRSLMLPELIKKWETMFEDKNVDFHIIESDAVEQTIIDFVTEHKSNILATLTHNRGFFERLFHQSLTQKLAFHSQIPLLVLHNQKS